MGGYLRISRDVQPSGWAKEFIRKRLLFVENTFGGGGVLLSSFIFEKLIIVGTVSLRQYMMLFWLATELTSDFKWVQQEMLSIVSMK